MANKIHKPAVYEEIRPSDTTPPPQAMLSGFYHAAMGYRVVRPHGAGSWLLFFTVAGTGLLRQPRAEWRQGPGAVALLAPDAFSDYGVPFLPGRQPEPLVKAAYHRRFERYLPVAREKLQADPTRRYVRFLHLDPRRPWPDSRHGWRFHWIHFQPRPAWASWLHLPEAGSGLYEGRVEPPPARARIEAAFQRIHQDLLGGGLQAEGLAYSALEEIFQLLNRENGATRLPLDPRIAAALDRIRDRPSGGHAVAALAQAAALSPSRFAHLFKSATGTSVAQQVIHGRVAQARKLLASTEERISDIAYALGYCSPYYFSRQFKALAGLSPKAFRMKMRSAPVKRRGRAPG